MWAGGGWLGKEPHWLLRGVGTALYPERPGQTPLGIISGLLPGSREEAGPSVQRHPEALAGSQRSSEGRIGSGEGSRWLCRGRWGWWRGQCPSHSPAHSSGFTNQNWGPLWLPGPSFPLIPDRERVQVGKGSATEQRVPFPRERAASRGEGGGGKRRGRRQVMLCVQRGQYPASSQSPQPMPRREGRAEHWGGASDPDSGLPLPAAGTAFLGARPRFGARPALVPARAPRRGTA